MLSICHMNQEYANQQVVFIHLARIKTLTNGYACVSIYLDVQVKYHTLH